MTTQGPSAEARLAEADRSRRRVSDFNDRQTALRCAVRLHIEFDQQIDQVEILETAAVFLRFLETGDPGDVQ